MKKVLLIAGCVLLCMVLVVALLAVFWRNDPDDPAGGGDQSMVYRAEDAFPTQAGNVETGPWGYYSVQSGCVAKDEYTALTTVENQEALGALGLSDGTAARLNLSPVVAYEENGEYSAEADLEITRPDMTCHYPWG